MYPRLLHLRLPFPTTKCGLRRLLGEGGSLKQVERSEMTSAGDVAEFRLGVRFCLNLETHGTNMYSFIHPIILLKDG